MPTSIRCSIRRRTSTSPLRSVRRDRRCRSLFWRDSRTKSEGAGSREPTPSLLGGAKRDRTVDLYNAIVALSQLSYGPETLGGGARYNSCPPCWQQGDCRQQLAVALALVVLDFNLDLEVFGIVGKIVGIRQRLVA